MRQTNSPLVSIVLPTFNRAALIGDAIRSCLDQSWTNLEVIVVDDGSTDRTEEVALSWVKRDARVRYIKQANGKIPSALNTGFKHAQGEFYTWTSDDNRYEPEAIEIMAGRLLEDPEIGLVYCNVKIVNADGEVVRIADLSHGDLLSKNCVGSCFMYRQTVAEAVGSYDTTAFLAEDYDYWLRIAKRFQIRFLDVAPYRYCVHESSLTSTRGADVELQAAKVRVRYARNGRDSRRMLATGYTRAAGELRLVGHFSRSAGYCLRSLWLAPIQTAAWKGTVASVLRRRPRREY